jgi:hypothetical protein
VKINFNKLYIVYPMEQKKSSCWSQNRKAPRLSTTAQYKTTSINSFYIGSKFLLEYIGWNNVGPLTMNQNITGICNYFSSNTNN